MAHSQNSASSESLGPLASTFDNQKRVVDNSEHCGVNDPMEVLEEDNNFSNAEMEMDTSPDDVPALEPGHDQEHGQTPSTHRQKKNRGSRSGVRKVRFNSDMRDLRQRMRGLQRDVRHVIPEEGFRKLVRQITEDVTHSNEYDIEDLAMDTLQDAAEATLIAHFETANLAAKEAQRVTLHAVDMQKVDATMQGGAVQAGEVEAGEIQDGQVAK